MPQRSEGFLNQLSLNRFKFYVSLITLWRKILRETKLKVGDMKNYFIVGVFKKQSNDGRDKEGTNYRNIYDLKYTRPIQDWLWENREKLKITSGIPVWRTDNGSKIRTELSTDSFQPFFHSDLHEGLDSLHMEITLKHWDWRLWRDRKKLSQ